MLRCREYGDAPALVVLLHGGPGAPGYLEPVARRLAGSFTVMEPFQRGSGGAPLTVDRHVRDLQELLEVRRVGRPCAVVGHSWGAMLALAHAAAFPDATLPLVLVGCGTFDEAARASLQARREQRLDHAARRRMESLGSVADADRRLALIGGLMARVDAYEPAAAGVAPESCDARAHGESWSDMMRLQAEGIYPAAFAALEAPVLMLHGEDDPHPGRMILEGLRQYMPQVESVLLERCGHHPWLERHAREPFFEALHAWLERRLSGDGGPEHR